MFEFCKFLAKDNCKLVIFFFGGGSILTIEQGLILKDRVLQTEFQINLSSGNLIIIIYGGYKTWFLTIKHQIITRICKS